MFEIASNACRFGGSLNLLYTELNSVFLVALPAVMEDCGGFTYRPERLLCSDWLEAESSWYMRPTIMFYFLFSVHAAFR